MTAAAQGERRIAAQTPLPARHEAPHLLGIWGLAPHPAAAPRSRRPRSAPPQRPRQARLPNGLEALWGVVEESKQLATPEVLELVVRIRQWLKSAQGTGSMNRAFAAWRVRSPEKLAAWLRWLRRRDTRAEFTARNADWARLQLCRGIGQVCQGTPASEAFHAARAGRR